MRGFRDRAEVADVQKVLVERLRPLSAETVSLREAAGRVLAADVVADVAVPPFDRAAMDGYALHAEETFGSGPYNPLDFGWSARRCRAGRSPAPSGPVRRCAS